MKGLKRKSYLCLALCDLFVLGQYLFVQFSQMFEGRIPFYDDLVHSIAYSRTLSEGSGYGWVPVTLAVISMLLLLSFFVSIYWYFRLNSKVKWLVLLQFPCRLAVFVPTVPYIINWLGRLFYQPNEIYLAFIPLAFLTLMEAAKVIYLFKLK